MSALSVISSSSRAGRHAGLQQDLVDQLRQVGHLELDRREVDGDRIGLRPVRGFLADLAQDPFAEMQDQIRLLGDRDELRGRDVAVRRMVPARQRLEADDLAGRDRSLRLVEHLQLVVLERLRQLLRQDAPLAHRLVHVGREEAGAGAAVLLGAVERQVGVGEELSRVVAVARIDGDADRKPDMEGLSGEQHRLGEDFEQLVGEPRGRSRLIAPGLHDHELVAAEARCELVVRQERGDACRGRLQKLVAGGMAVHVVDLLEAVEIDDHQRQLAVLRLHGGDVVLQPVLEGGAVRQPGQRVEMRQEQDALLGGAPLAQIADREDAADGAFRSRSCARSPRPGSGRRRRVSCASKRSRCGRRYSRGSARPASRPAWRPASGPTSVRTLSLMSRIVDAVGEDQSFDRGVGDVPELRLRLLAGAARDHRRGRAGSDQQHRHGRRRSSRGWSDRSSSAGSGSSCPE